MLYGNKKHSEGRGRPASKVYRFNKKYILWRWNMKMKLKNNILTRKLFKVNTEKEIENINEFIQTQGFIFAVKYKLGLAKEGKSFITNRK